MGQIYKYVNNQQKDRNYTLATEYDQRREKPAKEIEQNGQVEGKLDESSMLKTK